MNEPTAEDWAQACDLKKKGREWVGPCPLCGGEDRFHVREYNGRALVGCRHCIDERDQGERRQRYGELLRSVFGGSINDYTPDRNRPWSRMKGHRGDSARTNPRPDSPPQRRADEETKRVEFANRLWGMGQPADFTPARVYLANRTVWPPDGMGPPLPENVRWLPRDRTGNLLRPLGDAAGYLLFALHSYPAAALRGVSCEALTVDGQRLDRLPERERWRRTFGIKKDAAFRVKAGASKLLLVEGEADALAAYWLFPDHEAWAVGGTGGLKNWNAASGDRRPVRIMADGDSKGREAGELARSAARASGRQVTVHWSPVGEDPADELAAALAERTAILESQPDVTRAEAIRLAWQQVLEGT